MYYGTPPIVTDGLVLNLDAANTLSYVSGSTVWRDLSGNNSSGSLINGPIFSSDNGGSIVFDGVNDRVALSTNYTISDAQDWTIEVWGKSPTTSSAAVYFRLLNNSTLGGSNYFLIERTGRILANNSVGGSFAFVAGFTPGFNLTQTPFHACLIGRNTTLEVYNNSIRTTATSVVSGSLTFNNLMIANGVFNPGGTLYSFKLYNRALSQPEITQNYNALKSRFNLT